MMKINIKRLDKRAVIPTRGSNQAAGYDLYACTSDVIAIRPGEKAIVNTGWAMEAPEGHFIAVYARSGLALRQGLRPANCVGIIDSDYRGEVKVVLQNDSDETQVIVPNERIAQAIIMGYKEIEWEEKEELADTERGAGGFGSTGVK